MRRRRRETPRDVIDAALNDANETVLDESEQRALVTAFEASTAAQRRFCERILGVWASRWASCIRAHCACGAFGGGDVWARSALHRWYYVEGARARAFVTMCDWRARRRIRRRDWRARAAPRRVRVRWGDGDGARGIVCGVVVASCAWWALGVWGSGTFDAGSASRGARPRRAWTCAPRRRARRTPRARWRRYGRKCTRINRCDWL